MNNKGVKQWFWQSLVVEACKIISVFMGTHSGLGTC